MTAIIAAMLWASGAGAVTPRAPTPDDREKIAQINEQIRLGLEEQKSLNKAVIALKEARAGGDPEEKAKAIAAFQNHRSYMEGYFNYAIDLTADLYHLKIPGEKPLEHGPLKGKRTKWRAGFVSDGAIFRELDLPGDGKHYTHYPENSGRKYLGRTNDDGEIMIRARVFERAAESGNPGFLASVIFHETYHFEQLRTPGASMRKCDIERDAYAAEKRHARTFGLSKDEIREIEELRMENLTESLKKNPDPGQTREPFATSEEQAFNKLGFEAVERARKELEEERMQLLESIERGKRERAAAEERARKEREAQRRMEEIAGAYGFAFENWDERGRLVFYPKNTPQAPRYAFRARYLDDLEAALFLARGCMDGRVATNAGKALAILRAEAGDPEFRKRIMPSTYGSDFTIYCFEHLLNNPGYLGSPAEIQELFDDVVEADRKAREWERKNRNPGGGSDQPPPRGDRGGRERERDRGGADLSPADRAVERGKRIKLP